MLPAPTSRAQRPPSPPTADGTHVPGVAAAVGDTCPTTHISWPTHRHSSGAFVIGGGFLARLPAPTKPQFTGMRDRDEVDARPVTVERDP